MDWECKYKHIMVGNVEDTMGTCIKTVADATVYTTNTSHLQVVIMSFSQEVIVARAF